MREIERANSSPTMAEKFPKLKSLKVDLAYFAPDGLTRNGEVRYKVNVAHAKSIFTFMCQNTDCRTGNFDLSEAIADAVRHGCKSVAGELRCPGTRERPKEDKRACQNLLRYKLTLAYV